MPEAGVIKAANLAVELPIHPAWRIQYGRGATKSDSFVAMTYVLKFILVIYVAMRLSEALLLLRTSPGAFLYVHMRNEEPTMQICSTNMLELACCLLYCTESEIFYFTLL